MSSSDESSNKRKRGGQEIKAKSLVEKDFIVDMIEYVNNQAVQRGIKAQIGASGRIKSKKIPWCGLGGKLYWGKVPSGIAWSCKAVKKRKSQAGSPAKKKSSKGKSASEKKDKAYYVNLVRQASPGSKNPEKKTIAQLKDILQRTL